MDVDAPNLLGETALMVAAHHGSDGAVASRLTACRSRLAALTQPRPQLEASIPSLSPSSSSAAAPAGEGLDTLRASLKAAVAEVTALTAARPGLVANLRRGFDRSAAIRTLAAAGGAARFQKVYMLRR